MPLIVASKHVPTYRAIRIGVLWLVDEDGRHVAWCTSETAAKFFAQAANAWRRILAAGVLARSLVGHTLN